MGLKKIRLSIALGEVLHTHAESLIKSIQAVYSISFLIVRLLYIESKVQEVRCKTMLKTKTKLFICTL